MKSLIRLSQYFTISAIHYVCYEISGKAVLFLIAQNIREYANGNIFYPLEWKGLLFLLSSIEGQ